MSLNIFIENDLPIFMFLFNIHNRALQEIFILFSQRYIFKVSFCLGIVLSVNKKSIYTISKNKLLLKCHFSNPLKIITTMFVFNKEWLPIFIRSEIKVFCHSDVILKTV